jgi:uncharacterized protein
MRKGPGDLSIRAGGGSMKWVFSPITGQGGVAMGFWDLWWLAPVGFAIGAYGTFVGAGGGFLLVPILLLLYPHESTALITCISLAVVFFNAASGSVAYARLGRIDYRSGFSFAAAAVPGAILGAMTTSYVPRRPFDVAFGVALIGVSAYLLLWPGHGSAPSNERLPRRTCRRVVESNGTVHEYAFDSRIGLVLSIFVGYLSSLLGIGGGIIHVPALVRWQNFPIHVATATSHFILAIMALAGTFVHLWSGAFVTGIRRTTWLAVGVILGAQLGALLSKHFRASWIMRGLAGALALVGVRILLSAL